MVRTKGQIRSAKSKGRMFERAVEASLKTILPGTYMTHEKGYVQQYDIQCDEGILFVAECKRHKSISWNQAVKWFEKLEEVAPQDYIKYLIFKSNQQPVLVIRRFMDMIMCVEFEKLFGIPFIKHEPVKRKNGKET
jgi:hypothetical protein